MIMHQLVILQVVCISYRDMIQVALNQRYLVDWKQSTFGNPLSNSCTQFGLVFTSIHWLRELKDLPQKQEELLSYLQET